MLIESKQVPASNSLGLRDMFDEDEIEDDIVEITWEDIEHFSDFGSPPDSDKEDELLDDSEPMQEGREMVDDSILKFSGHTGAVFCCAIHPGGRIAATGGEDDKAIIWNTTNSQIIAELTNFQDSVNEIGFSFDGLYLAASDMLGNIEVWKIQGDGDQVSVQLAWSEKVKEEQWFEWHKQAHVFMSGGIASNVYIWKIPSGECKVFSETSSTTGTFMPDGKRALIGYTSGSVKVFNLVSGEVLCNFKSKDWGLQGILTTAVHPNNNFAVVGDLHGKIALFTTQAPCKVVKEFSFSEPTQSSIENLIFSNDPGVSSLIVSTPTSLYIWDYTKQCVRHHLYIHHGVTKLMMLEGTHMIAVATTEGQICLVDIRTASIAQRLTGHTDTVLSLAYSVCQNKLLSTSDDSTARIFIYPDLSL